MVLLICRAIAASQTAFQSLDTQLCTLPTVERMHRWDELRNNVAPDPLIGRNGDSPTQTKGKLMKKFPSIAVILSSVVLVPAPSLAQDQAEEPWEGFYVGGTFGLGAQSNDTDEAVLFDTNRDGSFGDTVRTAGGGDAFSPGFCNGAPFGNNAALGCRNDRDDFDYSVRAGYDVQQGSLVFGALVEAAKSDSVDSVTAFSSTPASYSFSRKLDYSVGARGRVGFAAKGALFYATGGVSYGRIKNRFVTTNTANSFVDNGKTNSWGYSVGGGVEAKVFENFSLGLEFLQTSFTKDRFVVNVGPGTAPATNPFLLVSGGTDFRRSDPKFRQNSIRLTGTVRF
jgi:outer membrane immunogenic protein